MASLSTFWRLNLLPNPSLFFKAALSNFPFSLTASSFRTIFSLTCSSSNPPISQTEHRNRPPKRHADFVVLGIETSCDAAAAAVAVVRSNGKILSQVVSSQADLLAKYGGVAPKMVEEAHSQVVQETLDKAYMTEKDLTAVAVIFSSCGGAESS